MLIRKGRDKGFTLVEIVLAMAIFSFVLVVIISSISGLYRIYQAGVGIRDTQQQARSVSEEIARATRDAAHIVADGNRVCLFNSVSQVGANLETSSQIFALIDDPNPLNRRLIHRRLNNAVIPPGGATCVLADYPAATQRDLTNNEVAVVFFQPSAPIGPVIAAPGETQLNTILHFELRVASRRALLNELDLTDPANPTCLPNMTYCSITDLRSTVQARTFIAGGGE